MKKRSPSIIGSDRKKVNKSVSLNADVYDRLLVVCEMLGVNVNAYLVSAVGQQLSRDEAPVKAQSEMVGAMRDLFLSQMQSPEFNDKAEELASSLLDNKKP